MFRSVGSACCCVLRSMLPDYTLTQYRPSLLAYSVLQTITELCHSDPCVTAVTAGEDTATTGLEDAQVNQCVTAVRNFLHSTGAKLVYPVFY